MLQDNSMNENVTRRDFITGLCSKNSFKKVLMAWQGFNQEINKPKVSSCDEAAILLGKKLERAKSQKT
jgi:hypothetical protein